MTDKLKNFKPNANLNNATPPFGFPEGMAPSAVNDAARQLMASVREWYEDAEWRDLGHAIVSVVGQVITLAGDVRTMYTVNRAIRVNDTLVGTITASALATGNTAVTVEGFTPPAAGSITSLEVGIVGDSTRQITRNGGIAQVDANGKLVVTVPQTASEALTCNNTSTLATAVQAAQFQMINNPAAPAAGVTGVNSIGRTAGAQSFTQVTGLIAQGYTQGSGNVTNLFGARGVCLHQASGGTVTTAIALHASTSYLGSGYTVTNAYGLRIEPQFNATFATSAWGVFQTGSNDRNYLQGRLLLNTLSDDAVNQLQCVGGAEILAAADNVGGFAPTNGSGLALMDTDNAAGSGGALMFGNKVGGASIRWAGIKGILINGTGAGSGHLAFSTRNTTADATLTEWMRLLNNGRLLLNTATDLGQTLQVAGTVNVGASPLTETVNVNGTSAAVYAATSATQALPTGVNLSLRNASATDGGFAGITFSALHTAGNTSAAYIGAISNAAANSATLVFGRRTGATAYAEEMRLSLDGNLLIGRTVDTGQMLQVEGAALVAGTLAVNGASLSTTATTFDLINAAATTVNFAGAATAVTAGATTGTFTIRNATTAVQALTATGAINANGGSLASTAASFSLLVGGPTTVTFASAATTLTIGALTGTCTIRNATTAVSALTATSGTFSGAVAANGGSVTTTATTFSLVNATATTVNFAGAATAISIGAATGTLTINNATTAVQALTATTGTFSGALAANGGSITTTATTADLLNAAATTVNFAGAATSLNMGAATGTTAVNNKLSAKGAFTPRTNLGTTNAIALDGNSSNVFQAAINAAATVALPTNAGDGQTLTLRVTNGTAGALTVTFNAGYLMPNGTKAFTVNAGTTLLASIVNMGGTFVATATSNLA